MKAIKNFLVQLLNKNGSVSSKILFGIIMLIQAIVLSYTKEVTIELNSMVNSFLLAGEVLLGVSIVSDVASKIANKNDNV